MRIIPVIDLKKGSVVKAAGGNRSRYTPWISTLCPNADPLEAVSGFLQLYPFPVIYIADLDALEGGETQSGLLSNIREAHPNLELWVDAGFGSATDCHDWQRLDLGRPVLGTESVAAVDASEPLGKYGCVLSLDFKGGRFLGPEALLHSPRLWPEEVIAMNLDSVGSSGGPDTVLLAHIKRRALRSHIYAAGGIRNTADLDALAKLGIAGALVATALHEGRLTPEEIAALHDTR